MNSSFFDIDKKLLTLSEEAEAECEDIFKYFSEVADFNGRKVL